MKPGPPRKPSALRLVTGKPHRKTATREPKPEARMLQPPEDLSADAKVAWAKAGPQLVNLGLLTGIDYFAFCALCSAFGDFMKTSRAIEEIRAKGGNGLVIKTTNGNLVENPLVSQNRTARRDLVRFAAEFGMTPAARAGLDISVGTLDIKDTARKTEDPAADYFG